MSAAKPSLIDNFNSLSSGAKNSIYLGAFVLAIFTYGTLSESHGDVKEKKVPSQSENFHVNNPGSTVTTEGLTTELADAKKVASELQKQIELLRAQNKQIEEDSKTDGRWNQIANLTEQVQQLQAKVNQSAAVPSSPTPVPDLNQPLPGPNVGGSLQSSPVIPAEPAPPQVEIRVVGDVKRAATKQQKEKPLPYLPSGSNFEAVLLNGMDASTAIGANRTPIPALLRVKSEAILPNLHNFNVTECFVMVGGFGNMSSERVEMRTESMSCIDDKGLVWEGKMEGYLVGEDGKAGARGRMVSKQGALLAKSFMAGFAGGLGSAFAPQEVQALSLATGTGGNVPYQYPAANQVIGSGMSKGLSQSANALAAFYIKMAEQMFPVLELDAGRKMTIILLKGVELKLDKDKS